ncbi:MAG: helix-turn-helix domain-containing protein [Cellulomonadaceae bacterium]
MSISSAKNKVSFYMPPQDEERTRAAFRIMQPRNRTGTLSHLYTHAILAYVETLEAAYNGGEHFPDPGTPRAHEIFDRLRETDHSSWPTAQAHPSSDAPARRFVPLEHIQEVLSISRSQAYALVRTGDLRAIRVGGRNQWRVELTELESYIKRAYQAAAESLANDTDPQE